MYVHNVCLFRFFVWLVKVEGVDDFILLFGYCRFGISAVACVRFLLEFHPNKTSVADWWVNVKLLYLLGFPLFS